MVLRVLAVMLFLVIIMPAEALAQRQTTREALEHMEEILRTRIDEGVLTSKQLVPAIVVSTAPMYEESKNWFPAAAVQSLGRIFGLDGLRLCQACLMPRTFVERGRLEQSIGTVSIDEIVRLDDNLRNQAAPAKTAIWIDEYEAGVALRFVDLKTGRIVLAENIDALLAENTRTVRNFSLAKELERRAKGESLTHAFIDIGIYPNQHFSFDWSEQWGDANTNLSGFSISLFDPVLGAGGHYFRVIPEAADLLLGGKIIMSIPTAFIKSMSNRDVKLFDNLVTGIIGARLPIPLRTGNYGFFAFFSTNGRVGLGVSTMNMSILPVLP